jgi:hypothetical protein
MSEQDFKNCFADILGTICALRDQEVSKDTALDLIENVIEVYLK